MNMKNSFVLLLLLISTIPSSAGGRKKELQRGLLEKMEAVPCGAKQKGLSGLGSLWASAGITDMHSDEKLCPQYWLRTDQMDYQIRPTDLKHAIILPVGQEGQFKIKKDHMFLALAKGGDHKMRSYQVVGMIPSNPDTDHEKSSSLAPDEH